MLHFKCELAKDTTIKDGFEEFLKYKQDEGISAASIKTYKTFYKYLLIFCNENKPIHFFNNNFFKEIQEDIKKLPKNFIMTRHKPTDGEYEKLSGKYINSMFSFYKNLWNFFNYKNYTIEKPVEYLVLKTKTTNILPFDTLELQVLIRENTAYDSDIVDYIKIGLYTGMRISEIIELKKDNIDLKENLINITKSKTKSGIRIIPIHKNIKEIINKRYEETNTDYLFSEDGNINKYTKRISKGIRKFIKEPSKSFHSTRKNFTQKLYEYQQQDLIQENTIMRLLGHSNNKNLSFSVYNLNKIDLDILRKSIDLIEY